MDEIIFNDIIDKFPNEKLINFTNQINFNYTKYKITNDTLYIYNKNNDNFSKFYKNVISSNRFKHQIKLFCVFFSRLCCFFNFVIFLVL